MPDETDANKILTAPPWRTGDHGIMGGSQRSL